MHLTPVSTFVNNPRNEGPHCIEARRLGMNDRGRLEVVKWGLKSGARDSNP